MTKALLRISAIVAAISFLHSNNVSAQTQFWSDDFEGVAPSTGLRTPSNNGGVGGPPYTSYFCRTPATSTVSQVVSFTGFQGSNYWAGEAHNTTGTGFAGAGTAAAREQSITWTGIDITGRSGLTFTGSFAANSTNQPFDNRNACNGGQTTNTDYVIVQYQIDGGAWTNGISFFSMGPLTQKYLFQETTGDSCGDGTQLTNVFQDLSFNVVGTGSTMSIRLFAASDAANEEWGIDNFRLFQSATLPVEWEKFNARVENGSVILEWSTLSEHNTLDFTVQHNLDGSDRWSDLDVLTAAGNSNNKQNYRYTHVNPSPGTNFYRIRQRDRNTNEIFTTVRKAEMPSRVDLFTIESNPVLNNMLRITLNSSTDLSLFDMRGALIWKKRLDKGTVSIPVGSYSKGIYLLRAGNQSKKIIIQ